MKKSKLLAVTLLGAVLALAGCGETHTSSSEGASSSTESSVSGSSSSSSEVSSSSSEEASNSSSSSDSTPAGLSKADVSDIIAKAITAQGTKVYAGVMSDDYGSTTSYEYGTDKYGNFTKIANSYNTYYYGYNAAGDIYGLQVSTYDGSLSTPWSVDAKSIYGPSAYFSSINTGSYLYGVQGILEYISGVVEADANGDFEVDGNSAAFSFSVGVVGTLWGSTALHVWSLDFTMQDDVASVLTVKCTSYTGENIEADYETNKYSVVEGADAEQTTRFVFAQSIGDKTATNPYDIEGLYFTSINYKDSDGNDLGTEYSVGASSSIAFTVDSYEPSTASFNIDGITLTHDNTENPYGISGGYYNGKYTINAYNEGDYNVTLSTAHTSKTFLLHVTKPTASEIGYVQGYTKEGDTYSYVDVNEESKATVYAGQSISLSATISPTKADQSYTAEIVGDNATDATLVSETIKPNTWSDDTSVYTFTSNVPGTYEVKISSTTVTTVSKTITITVVAAPELSGLLAKRYTYTVAEPGSGVKIYDDITFTPSASDATTGTVSIYTYDYDNSTGSTVECSYTYDAATRSFSLTKDGAAYTTVSLAFSTSYNLVITTGTGDDATSTIVKEFDVATILMNTAWYATASNSAEVSFSFMYDGTVSFETCISGYDEYGDWDYTLDAYKYNMNYSISETDDGYVIVLSQDDLDEIAEMDSGFDGISKIVMAKDFSKLSVTLSYDGTAETVDCSYTRG